MLASRIGFVTIAAILLGFALSVFTITPADAASCPTFTRTLSRGSSGTDVRALQTFFTEQYQNFTQDYVTGYFGPTTEAAVKQWQTSHSLVSSGTPSTTGYGAVGPRTRNAITQSCGGTVVTPTPTPTPTTTSTITRNLSRGSTGSDVIILQRILIAEGLLSNDSATGFFGALTEAAVQRFQAQNGIVSTGSPNTTGYGAVGPRTRTFITPLGIVGGGGSTGGWTPPPPPTGGDGGVWNTTPTSCTFNGATVAHGASVTAYQTSSVPTGQTCTSQTRACTDGILSKTYQYDSCTVSAAPPAPICSLTASPSSITAGQSSTLTWSTTNASSASINQSVGTVTTSGSRAVSPSATTQYTLTATGAGGTATCAETVTVAPLIQVAQWESGTTLAVSGLDGIACTIGNARTENGQEAGLAQATDNYSTLEGVGVTACLDVDFGSTQYREAKIGYRMLQSICGDSCSGSFCSTYPSLHVFTSVDRSIWNRHTSLPSSLTQTSSTASSATPFRYVRVCRNGFGASRANIAVDYVLAKKG
ncbi:MAG: peptidoglycan-binding protein, partial [bacterium]|nr:peptidoglycan-binding protein [bacterium]